ncbi:MAG: hypothetical protein L3J88_08095 [Gammaproteobacteria bacterium]|nr:hypothetical protein [Gammaproteobacteria bacterium]MCF6363291.1 hypothetical protein [Gammaproteobacteria bacterium]
MTAEIGLSSLMLHPLQLPGALDAMAANPASQIPTDEQAARLRSQAPLATNLTNRVETAAAALRAENALPAPGSLRAEPSGMSGGAAVNELNLTPAAVAALHAGAAHMQPLAGTVPADEAAMRRRRDSQREEYQGNDESGQAGDDATERPDEEKRTVRPGDRPVPGDDGRVVEGVLEPSPAMQDDALFDEILDALVNGGRSDMLRQLQGARRIMAVFPFNDPGEPQCAARACFLWRDAAGKGQVAGLTARLGWSKAPRDAGWMVVRAYKDRAANSRWRLRVQPTVPGPRGAVIQVGRSPMLPGLWTEVRLHIPDASRFWAILGAQFSLQVVISTVPLHRWHSP